MRRVITGQWKPTDDRRRRSAGDDRVGGKVVPNDLVVRLREEIALVQRDSCPSDAAAPHAVAKPHPHVGYPIAGRVAKRDEKPAARRWRIAVVATAPGVDVHDTVRRDHHVTRMPDGVGEDGGTEASRQGDAAVV